jgi:hypothetical protein
MVSVGFLSATLLAIGDLPPVIRGDPALVPFALAGSSEISQFEPAVARIVQSLTEYTHWPQPRPAIRLCITGPALFAGRLDGLRLADGRMIERRSIPASAVTTASCDAVYIGQLAMPAQRQLTATLRGRGVLTIAEADPQCRSQAMFCLSFAAQGASFQLNIDAVSRSGLRVDPRVLRLATGQP